MTNPLDTMKFTVKDTHGEYKDKPISYFHIHFSEQWRAASSAYIAASKLEVGQTVYTCGIHITRTE